MDRVEAMKKIKKCLALSKSANSNEAATALRHAQKLMEMHNVSNAEVDLEQYGQEHVDVPIQITKKPPLALARLVQLVRAAFGVQAVYETRMGVSDLSFRVRYFGRVERVQMAVYAHTVIYRAYEAAWRQMLEENPSLRGVQGARASFQVGYLAAIREKVDAIGFSDEEAATLELVKSNHYGHELVAVKARSARLSGEILDAGKRAGAGFEINRPMGQQRAELGRF